MPLAPEIWRASAPGKVRYFAWLALHNRLWTADRLRRRGIDAHETCPLCGVAPETLDHIFAECAFTRQVWSRTMSMAGLPAAPRSNSWLAAWDSWSANFSRPSRRGVVGLFLLITWTIWKERNGRVFNASLTTPAALSSTIRDEVREWGRAGYKHNVELWTASSNTIL
ncbi:hypothetical protein ACP70R_014384 [Stipagrostis hirtigluma subsp. patula]